jgi:lipopolysaccharide biosynthesis glycosyltransferase
MADFINPRKTLAYYTVGFSPKYLNAMLLSIKSLRYFNKSIDIWIVCDEEFVMTLKSKLDGVSIFPVKNSKSSVEASMNKLTIFQHSDHIFLYDNVIYIDSDILIGIDLISLLDMKISDDKLIAYAEHKDISAHHSLLYSLQNYDSDTINYFKENNIYVISAGLFAFKPTKTMQSHFSNILSMIENYRGEFFYEQSFMNVYFNTRNLVDYSVFTPENCLMVASLESPSNKILHFAGDPGNGDRKIKRMSEYIEKSMTYLL